MLWLSKYSFQSFFRNSQIEILIKYHWYLVSRINCTYCNQVHICGHSRHGSDQANCKEIYWREGPQVKGGFLTLLH